MKKKFTTYNPYARLPKAQDGMNVRGNRNQLAQKETTTKNVGTWFEDAGKWILNTLLSPIEGITQTNFYDPDMAHSGWQQFDDVFEGVHKGVGDALGYVYGGPMHAAVKAGGKGMMDSMGVEEDVAPMSVQYGGKIPKAQTSMNLGGGNTANNNANSFSFKYDNTDPRMVNFDKDLQNWITTTYPMAGQGTMAGGQPSTGTSPYSYSVTEPPAGTYGATTNPKGGSCVGGGCGGVKYASGMTKAEMANQNAGGTQQPSNIPTNAGTYGDPTKGQGWSDAVMDAASDPAGAIGNMVGGFANAGKNPVVAKDTGVYQEITNNTDSHPGSLAQSMGDIIAGVDPTEYAYTKKHEDNAMRMKNASKQMRAVGNIGSGGIPSQYGGRLYQMGGTVSNPYMKTHIAQENAKSQGGMENMAGKVGAAIQHAGGVIGESLSGAGMGGGGGMGGMMGGGGQGGGGMGGMMDMLGGGEGGGFMSMFGGGGGESGGGMMDMVSGMMGGGGEGGGGGDMMGMLGGLMGQNGGRVPVRKGKSPYIATHYYQNGDEVKPEDMPRKATAADLKRINEWLNNTKMVDTPYPPTDSTDNPYYNIMNEIDSLSATPQGSNENFLDQPFQYGDEVRPAPSDQLLKVDRSKVSADTLRKSNAQQMQNFGKPNITRTSPVTEQERLDAMMNANSDASRLMNSLGGGLPEPNMEMRNQHRMNEIDSLKSMYEGSNEDFLNQGISNEDFLNQPFQYGGIPKAQMGGGLMDMLGKAPGMDMIQKLMGGLGGGGGQGGGGMDMSGMMEKMQNMDPEQWKAIQGMFKDGFSAEGLGNAIGGSAGEGIAGIVGGFMGGGGGGATKQNGGRLEKTSNLPMDMEGFTDLEPGFNRSNTIEINSGNNHSDLDNPHTPLNVPVPSFDEQGNAMTENVQILAEKGEFARKDPETEAVTIFSKNLKTKDSSGKRTNYAKIAEKLGKKEDRLTEQAKNPFDDIADASIQRALSNVKNKFIRLEEEQKVAKEVKEEEDRMDLMQLAKNGGRITKKNTYRMGGKVKTLSEYQKELIGMDDQGQMPMAQNGSVSSDTADDAYFADPTVEDNTFSELFEDEEARKKAKEEPLKDKEKQKEFNKRYREERRQERKDARSGKREQRYLERERRKLRKRGGEDVSDLAKQIKELPGGGSEKVLDPYTNEGARKAKELIENEYGPLDTKGGLPCPPCEDGSIPSRDSEGNCLDCYSLAPEEEYTLAPEDEEETGEQQQQQRRASSGDSAINDYINNLRGINADVENRFEPYPNFFEDYGRDSENIARNAINDLPEWYMDRASQLASANVNSLENQIRNMGQSMGTSGYLGQMQAAKNKELAANQGYAAQAVGQREQQLGKLSALMAQNELYDRTGAEQSFDRTQEARDAIDAAKYDTEKNILTGRLAQTREDNAARRNELLDSQMQWMYNNDRTQYDKNGNPVNPDPVNPDPAAKQYGGKIKRDMYEYGSRVKRERQMKSDKAINEFRSFMRGFNKK